MYKSVLKWLDFSERMEVANAHGVTTRQQVHNIIMGKSKNFALLTDLIQKAEANKKLYERARQLEQGATS